MKKIYFKPIVEIIEAETIHHIAHSDDWADGKDNGSEDNDDFGWPDNGNNDGNKSNDVWNLWD